MQMVELVVTVINFDNVPLDELKYYLESAHYPNRCIAPKVQATRVRDIGEWSDDHLLNKAETADAEYHRLFKD